MQLTKNNEEFEEATNVGFNVLPEREKESWWFYLYEVQGESRLAPRASETVISKRKHLFMMMMISRIIMKRRRGIETF